MWLDEVLLPGPRTSLRCLQRRWLAGGTTDWSPRQRLQEQVSIVGLRESREAAGQKLRTITQCQAISGIYLAHGTLHALICWVPQRHQHVEADKLVRHRGGRLAARCWMVVWKPSR